jgi:hypothetical protein
MMPRINSSMMTWAGYDDSTGELDITFIGGKTYRYFEVPSEIYDGLLDAESQGVFFNENIKDVFRYSEVLGKQPR